MEFYTIDYRGFVMTQPQDALRQNKKMVYAHILLAAEEKEKAEEKLQEYIEAYIRGNRLLPRARMKDEEVRRVARTRIALSINCNKVKDGVVRQCEEFKHLYKRCEDC